MEPQTLKKRPRSRNFSTSDKYNDSNITDTIPSIRTALSELSKNETSIVSSTIESTSKSSKSTQTISQNESKRIRKSTSSDSDSYAFRDTFQIENNNDEDKQNQNTVHKNTKLTKSITSSSLSANNNKANIPITTTTITSSTTSKITSLSSSSSSSSKTTTIPTKVTLTYTNPNHIIFHDQTNDNTRPAFTDYLNEINNYKYFTKYLFETPRVVDIRVHSGILRNTSETNTTLLHNHLMTKHPIDLYNYYNIPIIDYADNMLSNRVRKLFVCEKEYEYPCIEDVRCLTNPTKLKEICIGKNITMDMNTEGMYINKKNELLIFTKNVPLPKLSKEYLYRYIIMTDPYLQAKKYDVSQSIAISKFDEIITSAAFKETPVLYIPSSLSENEKGYKLPIRGRTNIPENHICQRSFTCKDSAGNYILCKKQFQQPFYYNNIFSPEIIEDSTGKIIITDTNNILSPNWSTDYLQQLYQCNRERENDMTFRPNFNHQTCYNMRVRSLVLDLLIDIHHLERLHPETLFLTINLFDRYMSSIRINDNQESLGIMLTCLWIASKHEEEWQKEININRLVSYGENLISKYEIKQLESKILTTLQFRIAVPTIYKFFTYYCIVTNVHEHSPIAVLALYIIELSLIRFRFTHYLPSALTAAAFNMAIRTFRGPRSWTKQIIKEIGYTQNDLKSLIYEIETIVFGYVPSSKSSSSTTTTTSNSSSSPIRTPSIESYVLAPRSIIFKYTDFRKYRIALQPIVPLIIDE